MLGKHQDRNDKLPEYDEDDLNRSFESRLREELMKGYSPDLRPVQNTSTITFVNLTLINIQIIKVVSDLTT